MSDAPAGPSVTAPLPYVSPWQRWRDFWFHSADPTTLGFIRIMTGLLVLYIHLAYSLDLQTFFGEHGWYAYRFINRERLEAPYHVPPLTDSWDAQPPVFPQLSEFPHRRAALMQYLRALPGDPTARARELAYWKRVGAMHPTNARIALEYVQHMGLREDELERYLNVLRNPDTVMERDGKKEKDDRKASDPTAFYKSATPQFFKDLPEDERAQLAGEIRACWHSLANIKWANPGSDRAFVFNHFIESGIVAFKALVEYAESLPADAAERKKLLDYLEYWNQDPRKTYRTGGSIFSFWFHVTDPTEMALIHTGVLVLIALFTLGFCTRVTSVLVWLATVSYIHRTQQILFGMDTMMNILLFYLMIGNSGAALSIDRLIARYRAARASLARSGRLDDNTRAFLACPPPSVGAGFALRLIQVHFCFIYAAAGLAKLKGGTWWNGQAFWEVVVNPEFTLMQYTWYESGLRWLASFKPVYYMMLATSVWFTLFVEIAGPFLLWTRLRWLMILLATAMHAAIGVLMGLNLFELLMIVMLLAFLPDRVIRDRFRGKDLSRLTLTFNPANATHARAASLVLASDIDNQVKVAPNSSEGTVHLVDAAGKPVTGAEGVTLTFRELRLYRILSLVQWIPGIRGLMAKLLFPTQAAQASLHVKPGLLGPSR